MYGAEMMVMVTVVAEEGGWRLTARRPPSGSNWNHIWGKIKARRTRAYCSSPASAQVPRVRNKDQGTRVMDRQFKTTRGHTDRVSAVKLIKQKAKGTGRRGDAVGLVILRHAHRDEYWEDAS